MLCKVCNTRIAKGRSACPNCGSNAILKTPEASRRAAALPHIDYEARAASDAESSAESPQGESAPPTATARDTDPEVELNEPAEVELNEPAEVELNEPAEVDEPRVLEEKEEPPMVAAVPSRSTSGSPDADALRTMLAEQPDLLEPGLKVFTSEKGTPQGIGYTSSVGEIDLLARDARGGLVVVMIAGEQDGPELISGVLQRIGWVAKHLSGRAQGVRGIVLLESVHDSIAYAAAAVAETVAFKTWRVAVVFNDVEF